MTHPWRTIFDGAPWADGLVEAVVFVDQVAHVLELDLKAMDEWCLRELAGAA